MMADRLSVDRVQIAMRTRVRTSVVWLRITMPTMLICQRPQSGSYRNTNKFNTTTTWIIQAHPLGGGDNCRQVVEDDSSTLVL